MDDWTKQLHSGGHADRCNIHRFCEDILYHPAYSRLLLKLKAYNINVDLEKWVSDFLCNRKHCVILHRAQSSWFDVISGIPQGSVRIAKN